MTRTNEKNPKVFACEWDSVINQEVVHTLRLVKGAAYLLDLGCGEGKWDLIASFANHEIEIIGVDLSKESLAKGKKFARCSERIHHILADAAHIPFKETVFDVAFVINVFHHLPSFVLLENVLAEIKRVVKSGSIVLSVENTVDNVLKNLLTAFWDRLSSRYFSGTLPKIDDLPSLSFTQSQLLDSLRHNRFQFVEMRRENLFFLYFFTVLGILRLDIRSTKTFVALRKMEDSFIENGFWRYCASIHIIMKAS